MQRQQLLEVEESPERKAARARLALARLRSATPESVRVRTRMRRDPLRRRMLACADVTVVLVACGVVGALMPGSRSDVVWLAVAIPLWIVVSKMHGLYDRDHRALRHLTADELSGLISWSAVTTGIVGFAPVLWGADGLAGRTLAIVAALVVVCVVPLRGAARLLWRRATPPERAVIVGGGRQARAVRRKVELFADMHVTLVGELSQEELEEIVAVDAAFDGFFAQGGDHPLPDRVLLATGEVDPHVVRSLIAQCRRLGMKLSVVPPDTGVFMTAARLGHVADLPLLEYNTWDVSRSTLLMKRAMDIAISSIALIALSPVMLAVALAVRFGSPGPVLFVQRRAGWKGRPFEMFKYRTMCDGADARLTELIDLDALASPVFKLVADPRVTREGRRLRRFSLDELPQLLNVLRGDMSLVGPRPEQLDLVARYEPADRFRLAVKPGLTGPMQVYGRGELDFEERAAVEREYVENISIGRDVRILALTISAVFRGSGAY